MRFLRDGVPDGPPLFNYNRSFADVEGIEVLKGPGSAVYGSSAPGGVINLTSKKPSKNFGALAEVSAGGLGLRQVTGDVTGAFSENAAARLIFNDHHTDGIRGLAANIRELTGKLDYRINAANKVSLGYEHRENKNVVDNYGFIFDTAGQIVNSPRDSRYYSPFNKTSQNIDRFSLIHDFIISDTM